MSEIPKVLFTYWSGADLTYLHLISLRTVQFFHPRSKIIVYTDASGISVGKLKNQSLSEHTVPVKFTYDFKTEVSKLSGIEVVELDMGAMLQTSEPTFHAFCADYVRIYKLYEHGGVWFDLDLFFTKNVFEVIPQRLDFENTVWQMDETGDFEER